MTPLSRYQEDLKRSDFNYDPAQEEAVQALQDLFDRLVERSNNPRKIEKSLFSFFKKKEPEINVVTGLYFWGGVGRGKTYLMDTFFECLPMERKLRLHFHRFMQMVHQELRKLQDTKNPLEIVAKQISDKAEVLCFDEFFVTDITDAMILAGLLEHLFINGTALVATSNIEPDGLYKNGLQRARFLPAIDLVNKHTKVMNVDGGVDYRLRTLKQAKLYYFPLGEQSEANLEERFNSLAANKNLVEEGGGVEIEGRAIPLYKSYEDIAWFDIRALCDGPRSQIDYIEIAKLYSTVLISGLPQLDAARDDMARRFINLVDEFYDRHVKVIISADVAIPDIYTGTRLAFEYDRTVSRLLEMQSEEYLMLEHRP
ncbi:cell division protein ZapE [Marinomonas piezotolerans]|uniref:Cell division protein ZapE n=1 Tax=Marinomonas piezotolerans TaxID=2213058 RepID=A0A370UDF5_9GAMM|nr:cell division protein ZapE [Marinomonas piezotolerans]RDL45789.1 cell division protein ZapE [Marinomonas piezotolerans]